MELWGSVSGVKVLVCTSRADDWISPLCCIWKPYLPLSYSIWLVSIAGPAASPGQCETDTKPFHWLKEPQERRGKPAKPEAVLSLVCHTGRASEHEVITYVFNYDNHSKREKNGGISLCVNRKGNNSRPKLRKPSHNNGTSEIFACSQRTCWLKRSAHSLQKQNTVFGLKPASLKKCHYPFENFTHSDINLTNHRENWRSVESEKP